MDHANVACLGTKLNIESEDALSFYKELQRYVDSKEKTTGEKGRAEREKKPREMEFWPLIRVVKLCIKAPALATGAVIVDLPGVHDSNQARAAVAQDYMKNCTGLLIVAPITRAVDDKSAKTLLGESFKQQLKMDGGFNSVTFICSKTDDISITEAQDSLGLDEELAPMWTELGNLEKKKGALNDQIAELRDSKSDINAAMESTEDEIEIWENLQEELSGGKTVFRPKAKSQKRKLLDMSRLARKKSRFAEPDSDPDLGDGSDGSDGCASNARSDSAASNTSQDEREPLTEDEILNQIAGLRGSRKQARQEKTQIDEQIRELQARIQEVDKEHKCIHAKLSTRCIAGRNEYSRGAIRQDYAAGIRELDQELAEEEDAATFNPEVDTRDYEEVARNLPVFCVSSRAYQKLKGRLHKDNIAAGFLHIDETEVPALQDHCVQLTAPARQASSRKFLTGMFQLLNSLRLWASNDSIAKNLSEEQLEQEVQLLNKKLNSLKLALRDEGNGIFGQIASELRDNIYGAGPHALAAARAQADDIVQKWGSPVSREAPATGGLHWPTYKAVVRRDGCFTSSHGSYNFNRELLLPLIRHLAGPWEFIFIQRIPNILNELPVNVGRAITAFHNDVERHAVRNGASMASFEMLKQQIPVYQGKVEDAIEDLKRWIREQQRTLHREFEPRIISCMHAAYVACANEHGPGSFQRMREHMEGYVGDTKMTMFDEVVTHINEMIERMLQGLRGALLGRLEGIFKDIEREYSNVVIGQDAWPHGRRTMRHRVLEIVDGAELAFKRAVGLEADPTPQPEPETERQSDPAEASGAIKQQSGEEISMSDSEEGRSRDATKGPTPGLLKDEEPDDMTNEGSHGLARNSDVQSVDTFKSSEEVLMQ